MSFLRRLLSLVFTLFTALAPRSTTALDMGWVRQIWLIQCELATEKIQKLALLNDNLRQRVSFVIFFVLGC